jgi:hypothetical protein
MFELLLQADKSMSDGLLDQAERTYWQLIELDPTNAIAVAGLARISLQRGDERLARTLADRALGIDPDSIFARRVIQEIEEGASAPAGPSLPDLPLRGAERLEALSRRRAASHGGDEGAGPTGAAKSSGRPKSADRSPRAGAKPDEIEPMPSEPLREPPRAGRLAAAAAAREPGHARHEPHRAMPSGRHLFQAETLKAPASDPFSDAEMAAAVAAVDSLDEAVVEAPTSSVLAIEVEAAAEAPAQAAVEAAVEPASDLEHVLEAVDATEARESVALRLALLSEPVEMPPSVEPSEPEAPAEQAGGLSVESAEAAWWTVAQKATGRPVHGAEPDRPGAAGIASADEADADSAAGAVQGVADADSLMMTEPYGPAPADSGEPREKGPSEAEVQALRESVALVVADSGQAGATEGSASGSEVDADAPEADAGATSTGTGPVASVSEEPPDAEASGPALREAEPPPRKKGLFRRFRGS